MKTANDIARECLAWPILLAACYLAGGALNILALGLGYIAMPPNYRGEADFMILLIFSVLALFLGYVGSRTLLSLRYSWLVVSGAAMTLVLGSFLFFTFRHGA